MTLTMNHIPQSPVKNGINTASGPSHEITTSAQVYSLTHKINGKETIESYFYAYRLTGNKIYQDRAWTAFQHITAVTRAPYGYSSIRDVTTPGGWYQSDQQESFWLAE